MYCIFDKGLFRFKVYFTYFNINLSLYYLKTPRFDPTIKTDEMKKMLILITLATLTLGSCREKKTETKEIIREVHVETTDDTPPPSEGALERAAKKIDNKVNEKIDNAIDDID